MDFIHFSLSFVWTSLNSSLLSKPKMLVQAQDKENISQYSPHYPMTKLWLWEWALKLLNLCFWSDHSPQNSPERPLCPLVKCLSLILTICPYSCTTGDGVSLSLLHQLNMNLAACWYERTGNPLTGFLCFDPSLLFQHILKHLGQRWLEIGFYGLIPEIFESTSLRWTPEVYMLPSSQVVLIELIPEPTLRTLLWIPNSTENQWIIIIIIIKWEQLKWSLWGSHPWIFWSKWPKKLNGKAK